MVEKLTLRSQGPYHDDFDASKNFLQVLFRPSFPVQSRELTSMQSGLMEQIKRFADFNFKDGARVSGANITLETSAVRLNVTGKSSTIHPISGSKTGSVFAHLHEFAGKIVSNADGSVKALVLKNLNGIDLFEETGNLYVKYITTDVFAETGDYLYAFPEDNTDLSQTLVSTFDALTPCTIASISDGVYYVKGVFVAVANQSISIDDYTNSASVDLGLVAQEKVVTPNDDPSLFDNARGTTNEGAPGAHRMVVDLILVSSSIGSQVDPNFYRIATVIDGYIQEAVTIDSSVNVLMDILAERTHDESGDYTVTTPKPVIDTGDSESVFDVKINPFKAYVKGYQANFTFPQVLTFDKGATNQQTVRNYSTAVKGTPFFYINSAITGTLPGSTGGNPFTNTSRLLVKNSAGKLIAVCRGYAINDEIEQGTLKTKLYVYDLKSFQVIKPTVATTLAEGNDIYSLKTRGYVYTQDNVAGSPNGIVNGIGVINPSGKFEVGQIFASDVAGVSGTISTVTSYSINDAFTIENSTGTFVATVTAGTTVQNTGSSLLYPLDAKVKTFKDGSASIMDNDFSIIQYTATAPSAINAANGLWDSTTVNDQEENTKVLKHTYVKIKNSATRNTANYGWLATDKEITLYYPDVHKVYGVNKSTDNTFANGQFARYKITTTGIIPQGTVLTGSESGFECIVILQNSTNTYSNRLSNTSGYHETVLGTGSSSTIEIIPLNNKKPIEGESFISLPSKETNSTYSSTTIDYVDAIYPFAITFVEELSAAVGSSVNNLFELDSGQRDEFYEVGRLIRKDNTTIAPTGDLIVFFSYFEAKSTATKHYYSADTYAEIDYFDFNIKYNKNPISLDLKEVTTGTDLRDCLDFRLRSNANVNNIAKSPFVFSNRSFVSQSKILPNSKFTTDITEFLGRIDSVYLSKNAEFVVKIGKSSKTPKGVAEDITAMKLFDVEIPPMVRFPSKEVFIQLVDNKRYTMRDIGKIESRVNRIEEAVALSMLESQALHDDVGGRTKMGFIVDDFSTTTDLTSLPADLNHKEFNSSFDVIDKELISAQTEGVPVNLNLSASSNLSSFFSDYVIKNFKEEEMITQGNATNGYKINPFAVWTYRGDVKLDPSFDTWYTRENNYLLNNNGIVTSFEGDSDNWEDFLNITTTSPGGASATRTEWSGWVSTGRTGGWFRRRNNFRRSGVQTTITSFNQPRAINGTLPSETLTGSSVIQNLDDYFMRPMKITISAEGLMPKTEHAVSFGHLVIKKSITSSSTGTLSMSYTIPPFTFKAGTELVKIVDNNSGFSSFGGATFTSTGVLESYDVIQDVSTQRVTSGSVSETRQTRSGFGLFGLLVGAAILVDPIAQLFTLPIDTSDDSPSSSILTSADLWFTYVDTRKPNNTVTIQIRETVNGYPGGPDKIIGTTGSVVVPSSAQVTIPDATNSTNFKFKEPVKLDAGKEYAIVILSPSAEMSVYVAEMGKNKLDGSGIHSSQPNVGGYSGSFFISQNSSSWSAEQNIDLTFKINRANFATSGTTIPTSTVIYSNSINDRGIYNANVGDYYRGSAIETFKNSNYVKVYHPNHGLNFTSAKAYIERIDTGVTYNGIDASELLGLHDVYFPTLNTYFIKTTTKASESGFIYTPSLFAKQSVVYDGIYLNLFNFKTENDTIKIEMKTAQTNSSVLTAGADKISYEGLRVPTVETTFFEIGNNETVLFDEPRIIRNKSNSTSNDLTVKLTLDSTSRYSSPYYRVNPAPAPVVFRNITGYMLDDADLANLTVTSVVASDNDDKNQKLASHYAGISSVKENNAYITKEIDLEVPADGITLFFDAAMFSDNEIQLFYKAKVSGDDTPFDIINWVEFSADQQVNESNYGVFGTEETYKNYEARIDVPFDFQKFKIKMTMKTTNEALAPKVKNLRIIADI